MWDGDQLLFEIRRGIETLENPGTGLNGERDIEADSGRVYRLQFPEEDQDPETGEQLHPDTLVEMQAVGRVSYLHGLELDHPLVVDRLELGSDSAYRNLIRVWPFANWQGSYDNGDLSERCPQGVCINPRWPGALTTYQALSSVPPGDPRMWFGSLLSGMRDGSGQTYKRNRYYDATSGRFTQEDPIGLAGGMNLYGYANGDPVNYSDPFGLCPVPGKPCPRGFFTKIGATSGMVGGIAIASTCTAASGGICVLGGPAIVAGVTSLGVSVGATADAIAQNSDAIALEMGKVDRWIRNILSGILLGGGQGMSEEQRRI